MRKGLARETTLRYENRYSYHYSIGLCVAYIFTSCFSTVRALAVPNRRRRYYGRTGIPYNLTINYVTAYRAYALCVYAYASFHSPSAVPGAGVNTYWYGGWGGATPPPPLPPTSKLGFIATGQSSSNPFHPNLIHHEFAMLSIASKLLYIRELQQFLRV